MNETVECPYCEHENDMSHALVDGLSDDNTFDWECDNCHEEFEVEVEFEPSFSASKIEYIDCEHCGNNTRDIYEKGRVYPFPERLSGKRVCNQCFCESLAEEYTSTKKVD
ncbi:hypothetical protein ABNF65_23360 [Paenibacillus larvae]